MRERGKGLIKTFERPKMGRDFARGGHVGRQKEGMFTKGNSETTQKTVENFRLTRLVEDGIREKEG